VTRVGAGRRAGLILIGSIAGFGLLALALGWLRGPERVDEYDAIEPGEIVAGLRPNQRLAPRVSIICRELHASAQMRFGVLRARG
jgi:hypothetical protein